jgi:hypothetical protein
MPKVKIKQEDLYHRGSQLNTILGCLLSNPRQGGPASAIRTLQGKIVIVARDTEISTDIDRWRFATFQKDFRASYKEVWIPTDQIRQTEWFLQLAYLTIYNIERSTREEKEYICLHCDPNEPDSSDGKSRYKRSPHLHIKPASQPIPKAHIALAHGYLEQILSSEGDLFRAIQQGVELIRDEILTRVT